MQDTSLSAYGEAKEKMGAHQSQVHYIIRQKGDISNLDIARLLNWPINSVTPRVKELRDKGLVEEAYRDIHPETGRRVIYWRAVWPTEEIIKIADNWLKPEQTRLV